MRKNLFIHSDNHEMDIHWNETCIMHATVLVGVLSFDPGLMTENAVKNVMLVQESGSFIFKDFQNIYSSFVFHSPSNDRFNT